MRTHATIRLADQYAVRRIFDILQKDDWKAVLYSYYTRNEDALFAVRAHYSSLF
jgi:glycogen synthase